MNKKKIVWLVKGLGIGGVERLLAMSLPYLDQEKYEYHVAYYLPIKDDLVEEFESYGMKVTCLGVKHAWDIRALTRTIKYLRAVKPDVLEIHLPYPGLIGRVAAKFAGIKQIIYTEHSLSVQMRLEKLRFLLYGANLITYPLNSSVIAISESTAREIKRINLAHRPVDVILNGVDLRAIKREHNPDRIREKYNIPGQNKVVGHVATLTTKKRQSDLLKAAAEVLKTHPDTTFILVGRGPLARQLEDLAKDLGIERNVVFTGFVEDVYEVMATFDIFAMSSLHEGFCIALVEALALGKPVVATAVGGTPEVISDGSDGFLVPPKSPGQLAEKISLLLADDGLRESMGRFGRLKAEEKFDIRLRVKTVESLYERVSAA